MLLSRLNQNIVNNYIFVEENQRKSLKFEKKLSFRSRRVLIVGRCACENYFTHLGKNDRPTEPVLRFGM